jgi:hypothetical protein
MKGCAVVVVGLAMTGCLWCPGCGSTVQDPVTGAEAQYQWETLKAELKEGIATVHKAAREAVDCLDLKVQRDALDGIAAEILALDAHFDNVEIRLETLPESGTLLMIRVGFFGDKNKSVVLFERIMATLGPSESVADTPELQTENLDWIQLITDGQEPQRDRQFP